MFTINSEVTAKITVVVNMPAQQIKWNYKKIQSIGEKTEKEDKGNNERAWSFLVFTLTVPNP